MCGGVCEIGEGSGFSTKRGKDFDIKIVSDIIG
jgi:hypothetical protein